MTFLDGHERRGTGHDQELAVKEGWTWMPLGEVCKTSSGGTPLSSRKDFYEGGTIPWLQSGEVAQGNLYQSKNSITRAGLENSSAKVFPINTVLIAMYGATAGQVGILRFEAATNQAICGILPNEIFLPEFLFYFFLAKQDQLIAQATGNAQPNISQHKIKSTEVPIPPLSEQQRIVAQLDEAFEALATAKANAEQNLQNARALFESQLKSVFSQRGERWMETRLKKVCGLQNGYAFKSSTFKPSGTPILRISNIQNGRIDESKGFVFIDPRDYQENLDRYRVAKDDLLIAMSGATTGKLGFNTEDRIYFLNQRVGKLEPGEKLYKRFLYYYLSTKVEDNLRISAGSAQPNLSSEQIKDIVLPLPTVDEQMDIVNALEALTAETQRLTSIYERKLAALEELKTSLLHQAFNGEL